MLLYSLPAAIRRGEARAWWHAFRQSREISWDPVDTLPFWAQGLAMLGLAWTALRAREGLLEASTWDIRWNGEE
jgi:hypothetical protein